MAKDRPNKRSDQNGERGSGFNYGDLACLPKHPKLERTNFKPEYGCVFYLKLGGMPGAIECRSGYFKVAGDMIAEWQALAEIEMKQARLAPSNGWIGSGNFPRKVDFSGFRSNRQQVIFMIIDNDDAEFDDRQGRINVGLSPNLVRFTPYLGKPYDLSINDNVANNDAKPNHAFFGAKTLPALDRTVFKKRKILYLENWHTDAEGNNIQGQIDYSMNIHILVDTRDGNRIPIIIDPDTGNGYDEPPPPP